MTYRAAPTLESERLVLRSYRVDDFEAFAQYFASPRSVYTDGPIGREAAWDLFTAGAGRWMLVGYGAWTVELRSTGGAIGLVSLNTPITLPDPELGWILWDGFEKQGYAYEAAMKARQFAFDRLQWPSIVSGIHVENTASIRLAERLGAVLDPDMTYAEEPETQFYRHMPC
ncbi:MAG: GNAT family N-acetyltransferase [Pseudomonadota bacterium]